MNENRYGKKWERQELLIAFGLYYKIPFGRMDKETPEIVRIAATMGRTPSSLAMKLVNIASLDPKITSTGRKGLSGASDDDKAMWKEMHDDWNSFIPVAEKALAKATEKALAQDAASTKGDASEAESSSIDVGDYEGVDKETGSTRRVGQNLFRKAVMSAYNYRCCITGLPVPELLVASHIIPWSEDTANRLNPSNGLALSMIHDKAFDRGLITIDEKLFIVMSSTVKVNNNFFRVAIQNYVGKKIELPGKFLPRQEFLEYHRTNIFQQ
ncbi:MAG: HNH endonuclease [Gammaproteobacteria bacterium]